MSTLDRIPSNYRITDEYNTKAHKIFLRHLSLSDGNEFNTTRASGPPFAKCSRNGRQKPKRENVNTDEKTQFQGKASDATRCNAVPKDPSH